MPLIPFHIFEQDIPNFVKAMERIAGAAEKYVTAVTTPEVRIEPPDPEELLKKVLTQVKEQGLVGVKADGLKSLLYRAIGAIPLPDPRSSMYGETKRLIYELTQLAEELP